MKKTLSILTIFFLIFSKVYSQKDSSQFYILTGPNLYKSIAVYTYFDNGYLIDWDSKICLPNSLIIPIEFGFSNNENNNRRPELQISQQSFYAKAGVEFEIKDVYIENPIHVGFLIGYLRVNELRYVQFQGSFFDDYIYEYQNGVYDDFILNFYTGFRHKINKKIVINGSGGIITRIKNSSPKDYQFFVPGFGSLISRSNQIATLSFSLNIFYRIN